MEITQIILYSVILIPLIFDWVVELLNLSRTTTSIPLEFKKIYSVSKYKKSQEYLRANTKFLLIESTVSVLILIGFIYFGGFNLVDSIARNIFAQEILIAIAFLTILMLLVKVVSMPFEIYKTFVIEKKFGFNKTTPSVYVVDFFKSLGLETIIGGLIFAVIVLVFESLSNSAWFVAFVAVSIIQLIILFVYPVFIMPMFNKFIPLKNGELKTAIEKYAKSQNFSLQGIFTMDGSKRSTRANAFFTGFGRFRRIVLFDTLIKQHTTPELVAILAHEVGHFKKRHIIKQLAFSVAFMGFGFYILGLLNKNPIIFESFKMEYISTHASLIFLGIFAQPIFQVIRIAVNFVLRKYEYEADKYAVATYQKPKVLILALKKLTVKNLSNLTPHPVKVFADYSHPPIISRIEAIKKQAR